MDSINLKAAIQKSFSNIGKSNGTKPKESQSNSYPIAHELFVASELRSAANKRYDMAKANAFASGILDEGKVVEGAEVCVYEGELFDVTMKQASSSSTLDRTQLRNTLMRDLNLDDKAVDTIIAKASKPRKGAVTIGFSLKE